MSMDRASFSPGITPLKMKDSSVSSGQRGQRKVEQGDGTCEGVNDTGTHLLCLACHIGNVISAT